MGNTCSCCTITIGLPQVEDMSHLDEIISFIETRLHEVEESTSGAEITPISATVDSSIKYGSDFLQNVARRVKIPACKIMIVNRDSCKVVIDILKGAEQIHWVGTGLGVVAYVLQQMDNPSCVEFLRFMCGLAKHIKQLINHLPQEKLEDVVVFILKGSFFCLSQMQSTNVCSTFSALVNEEEINNLQSKLGEKYPDLNFQAVTVTSEERPTEVPSSQEKDPDEDDNQYAFNLPEKVDMNSLDDLMTYIEKCLAKPPAIDKAEENTSGVASLIKDGNHLLEKVLKRCKRHAFMSGETRKVVMDILKEASQIHWVAAGLSVIAYVLQRVDDVSTNKQECVKFLRYMYGLAKHVKQLKGYISEEKLHDVAEFIFEGSFFCVSRIQSSNLSRFFSSVVDVEKIKSLQSELGQKYRDLTLEAVTQLLDAVTQLSSKIPDVLPPSQGKHPDAVGINEAEDEVIKLLDLTDQSATSVVIYGFGGIGKTTLGTAVFSSLNLNAYKHCRLDIQQDCKEADLKKLQEQVLIDLFGEKIELKNCEEGKQKLSDLFRDSATQPLFLFIDNALKGSDLAKLLPKNLSCLPNRSRILITTRKIDETDMIEEGGVKRHAYNVEVLSDAESKKLLCLKALGSADSYFDKSLDIDRLVEICGGVPLVLELVGSKLRKLGNNVRACESTIQFLNDTLVKGEGDLSEKVVDVVYNTLQEDLYKDAFLDIAAFFNYWHQRTVGYIVGDVELKAIEEAALVKISEKGQVIVHDIVQARGRKLSGGDRITDHQSLQEVIDTQRFDKLKGICLPYIRGEPRFQLQAEHLDKMHKYLRVLNLPRGTEVSGACTRKFENLRYLEIGGFTVCSPMELNKLPRLAVFDGNLRSGDGLCDLSVHLRKLRVFNLDSLGLDESFGKLSLLEELTLRQEGYYMTRLPQSFGQLKSLRRLDLVDFRELTSLPDTFGQLSNLEKLVIAKCSKLPRLSNDFGQLNNLKKLYIDYCPKLCSLSDDFGQLESLEYLRITGCKTLQRLSDDFGSLTRVTAIIASECPVLEGKAVEQMIELESLMMLNICESQLLIKRWEEIKEGNPLLVSTVKVKKMMFKHSMSTALFDGESRFLNVDGVKANWSSTFPAGDEELAFLVTCCDLCSSSNEEACEMLKKKLAKLSREGFHIMYVYVGLMEQSEESIGQTLRHLSQGISGGASLCAWIPPPSRYKWKQFIGFSACMMLTNVDDDPMWRIKLRNTPLGGVHSFFARAEISGREEGKAQVEDLKWEKKKRGMRDFGGGFSTLYSPLIFYMY